jgi:hypothetical protein
MTVTSETSRVTYSGDGTTTLFPVPFYFISSDDLRVVRRASDGTETGLTALDYTVVGAGVQTGGSITLTSPLGTGSKLVIYRDPRMVQQADYAEGGRFPAASHERALDRIVMMAQRTRELLSRALKMNETDVDGAGRYRAGGNRISEVGDPFDAGDAVNKGYFDIHASNAAVDAQEFADEANAAADAANNSASAAQGYSASAATAATNATLSAASAAESATNAAAIAGFDPALFLLKSGNLSGLANVLTARVNLGLAPVAASGDYADLINKPAITYAALPDKPIYATVATTGAYADLTGKPTLGNSASRNVGTVSGTVAAGDDARFDQSTKAPLNSPALTGVPTAPTAAAGTNNQQIATTAFVMANSGATDFGAIGSYAFLYNPAAVSSPAGTILNGSSLQSYSSNGQASGTPMTGTWRVMGAGLYVRVT